MKYTLNNFSDFIENFEMDNINSRQCESFIMKIYSKAKYLSNQSHRNLRTFFNWTVENEYLLDSPIRKIKPPKVSIKNPEWLTETDLEIVLKKAENKREERFNHK